MSEATSHQILHCSLPQGYYINLPVFIGPKCRNSQSVCVYCRSTQGELEVARQRMDQLEAYLGGELPDVGVTWREERTALLDRVSVSHPPSWEIGSLVL